MNNRILAIAKELTNKNQMLKLAPNSVFSFLNMPTSTSTEVELVITGITRQLHSDISKFRNEYFENISVLKESYDKITSGINDKSRTSLAKYKIVEKYIPTLVDVYKTRKLVQTKRAPRALPVSAMRLENPGALSIYVKSGIPAIDTAIEELLYDKADDYLDDLWEVYVNNISAVNNGINILFSQYKTRIDDILLVLALVNAVKREQPKTTHANDTAFNNSVKLYISELANLVAMYETHFKGEVTLNTLVSAVSDTTVTVNSVIYDRYLESGKSDALLGYIISNDRNGVSLNNVLANTDKYATLWENKVKLNSTTSSLNAVRDNKHAYKMLVKQHKEDFKDDGLSMAEVDLILDDLLKNTTSDLVLDSNYMLRKLVARTYARGTVFEAYTDYMETHMKLNNKLTPKDAASLASIEITMDYLLQQVELVNG